MAREIIAHKISENGWDWRRFRGEENVALDRFVPSLKKKNTPPLLPLKTDVLSRVTNTVLRADTAKYGEILGREEGACGTERNKRVGSRKVLALRKLEKACKNHRHITQDSSQDNKKIKK